MVPPNSFPVRSGIVWNHRRSLRPRTDPRSYVDNHDIVVVTDDEPKANGLSNGVYESEEEEHNEAPIIVAPIKVFSKNNYIF